MSEIIDFCSFAAAAKLAKKGTGSGAAARYRAEPAAKREKQLAELTAKPNLTTTGRNQRLRLSRRKAWSAAMRLTYYWRARLDWQTALSIAQMYDVADANSFPKCDAVVPTCLGGYCQR